MFVRLCRHDHTILKAKKSTQPKAFRHKIHTDTYTYKYQKA